VWGSWKCLASKEAPHFKEVFLHSVTFHPKSHLLLFLYALNGTLPGDLSGEPIARKNHFYK